MFQWAQQKFDKLSQTVAPPPTDAAGRFALCVTQNDENGAMGCIAELDPVNAVVNQSKGLRPIHLACQYSHERLIRLLMNQPGMAVEQADFEGNTPLHYAAMSTAPHALDIVKLLISQFQASVLTKNTQGQTPYDVATVNSIRQYLLPIQLQAETQIALDNGGQGLPPGIDMGGLRIANPAMPPPPTAAGGFGASQPPAAPAGGAAVTEAGPAAQPHAVPAPSPQQLQRIVSAPAASIAAPASTGGQHTYSRVGSSSAALAGANKYRADGFHSSSSDVTLQRKYGHAGGGSAMNVAPPPSSGNAGVLGAMVPEAPASGSGGPNPFSVGGTAGASTGASGGTGFGRYGGLPSRRYVAYGHVSTEPAPVSGPAYSAYHPIQQTVPAATGVSMFTPGGAANAGTAAPATPGGAQPQATQQANAAPSPGTPTTPYMPPPPYQTHNYAASTPAEANGASYSRPDFVSPAAATHGSTTPSTVGTPATPLDASRADDVKASDIFASPALQKQDEQTEKQPTAGDVFSTPMASEPASSANTGATTTANDATTTSDNAVAPDSGLPSNWVETVDPSSGRTYYYNSVTHETSWEWPAAEGAALPANWVETVDPSSGRAYYYNSETQETSWERPASLPASGEATEQQEAEQQTPSTPSTSEILNPVDESTTQEVFSTPAAIAPNTIVEDSPAPAPTCASDAFSAPAPSAATDVFGSGGADQPSGEAANTLFSSPSKDPSSPAQATTNTATMVTSPLETVAPGALLRTQSAEEVFAESAPQEDTQEDAQEDTQLQASVVETPTPAKPEASEVSPAQPEQSPFAPPVEGSGADMDAKESSTAEQIFGASPAEPEPEVANEQTEALDETEGDGDMDDVPLDSPSPLRQPVAQPVDTGAAAAATTGADLFAAIGMPPPPISRKR